MQFSTWMQITSIDEEGRKDERGFRRDWERLFPLCQSTWKWWKLYSPHTHTLTTVQQLSPISAKVLVKQDAEERGWGRAQNEIEILFILLNLKTPKFSWRWWRWRKTIYSHLKLSHASECIYSKLKFIFHHVESAELKWTSQASSTRQRRRCALTISMDLTFFFIISFPAEREKS